MSEIINESTSKLWILAPVITIGFILYIITAILDKHRIKLDPFEDNLEKEQKFSKMILRTTLIGMVLLISFTANPEKAVTYRKNGNKLIFTSHNFIIDDNEFEIESESDDYYVIKKHDKSNEFFKLDKSELENLKSN